jgi:branched-chain amino acid transport system substrate-binding protein
MNQLKAPDKTRPYLIGLILAGIPALMLAGACGPRSQPVRIAVALPLTGDLGSEGQGLRRAVELAVAEANASGRLPFRLEVAAFDDRADPAEAENVAHLIVSDPRIAAVVGHYNSECSVRAARIYAQAPLAMISPASTNPELTRQQLDPAWSASRVAFRLVPTDDIQGAFAAGFVRHRLHKKRLAVAHDGTLYGRGLAEAFTRAFKRLGGKIAAEAVVTVGARDQRAPLLRLKAGDPDGIFFGGSYPEAGLLLKEMRRLGMRIAFCSGDGAITPNLFDVAGDSADGAYITTAGVPVEMLPAAQPFIAAYRKRWPGRSEGMRAFDYFGYEAANIIIAALASAGPDRARLVEAVRKNRYPGILGISAFDEKGDVRNHNITMTRARSADRSFPAVP